MKKPGLFRNIETDIIVGIMVLAGWVMMFIIISAIIGALERL